MIVNVTCYSEPMRHESCEQDESPSELCLHTLLNVADLV